MLPEPAESPGGALAHPGARSEGARWLTVGRLAPNKAVQNALMALLVARAHHDHGATIDVIGKTVVPAYTTALRRFSATLGLHDAVSFVGRLDDDALEQAMAQADVMVVTSEHEGFGVTVVEALRRGLPVVANQAGALPEVLGDSGVLVDAADPYELAAAVADLLGDTKRRATLAEAGRAQVMRLGLDTAGARFVEQVRALR
jgi:glycosyltransferase involved in cell wall biosynthesis